MVRGKVIRLAKRKGHVMAQEITPPAAMPDKFAIATIKKSVHYLVSFPGDDFVNPVEINVQLHDNGKISITPKQKNDGKFLFKLSDPLMVEKIAHCMKTAADLARKESFEDILS